MTAVAHKMEEDDNDMRERRDIVSGEIMPEHRLIRFVAAPEAPSFPMPRPSCRAGGCG